MADRLALGWEQMRVGLWPVPLLMMALAVLLYAGASALDRAYGDVLLAHAPWLHSGSGDNASELLSTLVSGIITMSSVVFSITIVALTLAANQFGSRLIRLYMSDSRTKVALGLFTMTIVYGLLALRAIDRSMPAAEVPHLVVTGGFALGLVCVLVMLLFLHFVGRSIVADEVIGRVAAELEASIAALPLLPVLASRDAAETSADDAFEERSTPGRGHVLCARREGYVQAVEYQQLVELAARHDLTVRLDFRAGEFMCKNGWLASVQPAEAVTPELADDLRAAILIGRMRTPTQDLEFSVRQLVDIALRALSPGINESNTATVVVDRLRGALSKLLSRALPGAVHRDAAGVVRVVAKPNTHRGILDAALNQIRQAAATQPAVIISMLQALEGLAQHVQRDDQRHALLHHARLVAAAGLRDTPEPRDRADIEAAFALAERRLRETAGRSEAAPRAAGAAPDEAAPDEAAEATAPRRRLGVQPT